MASDNEAARKFSPMPDTHPFFVWNGSQSFAPRPEFFSTAKLIADEAQFQSNVPTGMFSEGD
jgi:hypothetical protein